jgi:multiple sugar transport system permease protein
MDWMITRASESTAGRSTLLMLAPFVIGISVLIVAPGLVTLALSAFEYDLIESPRFLGFGNYRELLGDDIFRVALRNSLVLVAAAVPFRVIGAFGLALALYRRSYAVSAARVSVVVPAVMPDVAYALVWLWILNPLYGPLNLILGGARLPTPGWLSDPAAAQWAVIIMSVFQLGEGFLLALGSRASIPSDLYDLAAIEGASSGAVFRRVTLPLMAPALMLLLLRDTIYSLQVSFIPALLVTQGGPPPYATTYLPLFAYRNAFEYLRYGYAAAVFVVMFVVTGAAVWLQFRLFRRWRRGFSWRTVTPA